MQNSPFFFFFFRIAGGDQGLLNSYFDGWSRGNTSNRLPFLYNTTPTPVYRLVPPPPPSLQPQVLLFGGYQRYSMLPMVMDNLFLLSLPRVSFFLAWADT